MAAFAAACAAPQPQPTSLLPQPPGSASPSLLEVPSSPPTAASTWSLDQGPAFSRGNSTAFGIADVPTGDLILGAIDDRAAVWMRPVGGEWSTIPLQGAAGSTRAVAAAGGDDHVLIAVRDEEGDGSELWLMAGGGWRKVVAPGAFPPGWAVRAITWTGEEYVAVGFVSAGDPTTSINGAVAASWSSSDGTEWHREELQGPARGSWLTSVAGRSDAVLAGGQVLQDTSDGLLLLRRNGTWQIPEVAGIAGDQDEIVLKVLRQTATWYVTGRASPPECARSGCVTHTPRAWISRDGDGWTTSDLDDFAPAAFGTDGISLFGLREDVEHGAWIIASSSEGIDWTDVTRGLDFPAGGSLQAWGRSSAGLLIVGTDEGGKLLVWEWR